MKILWEHWIPPPSHWEPPFWNGTTTNNLYGFQIGADGKILERGRFSIDGLVKAGIFDNNAEQTTEVSVIAKQLRYGVRFDQPRRLRRRNRLAVQVSSYRASFAKGRLRSDLAGRRCFGAGTDSGNLYHCIANERCKRLASIATPACFITAPPPAWNIRFRNCDVARA